MVEVFEKKISAAKDRLEWQRLKTVAHQGKLDAMLVFALDRLGRSLVGNLQEVLALDRLGVEVISVREHWLDMGGPIRELLIASFSRVAQEERWQIASRCRAGQERACRQGTSAVPERSWISTRPSSFVPGAPPSGRCRKARRVVLGPSLGRFGATTEPSAHGHR
ncbi:recombinase family protein [Sorangium sp. So ce448]|uniref:recombinase family protein n=1 Tax=Sorangium sp. So ce448 TaxID=3133314 RepID=UPI003F61053E